jgi:hypothetical protein
MIQLESVNYDTKRDLEAHERRWIELLKPELNKQIPTRTWEEYSRTPERKGYQKEYYQAPEWKEYQKAYQKAYRQKRVECDFCKRSVKRQTLPIHCRTAMHKENYKASFLKVFGEQISDHEVPDHI